MALATKSKIVPMFAKMNPDGHVMFRFLPPLNSGTAPAADQQELLLRQYADVLEKNWETVLRSCFDYPLKTFLSYPEVENTDNSLEKVPQ